MVESKSGHRLIKYLTKIAEVSQKYANQALFIESPQAPIDRAVGSFVKIAAVEAGKVIDKKHSLLGSGDWYRQYD